MFLTIVGVIFLAIGFHQQEAIEQQQQQPKYEWVVECPNDAAEGL